MVVHSKPNKNAWGCASSLVYFEVKNRKLKFWALPNFSGLDYSWLYFSKIHYLFLMDCKSSMDFISFGLFLFVA